MQNSILFYLLSLSGGAGKSAVQYANILARNGYRVTVACGNVSDVLSRSLDPTVELKKLGSKNSLSAIKPLASLLRKENTRISFVIGSSNMLPFQIAGVLSGFKGKIVLREANSPKGLLSSYGLTKQLAKRLLFYIGFRRADHIIAITNAMREEIEKNWGVPSQKISVIYNGVAISSISPQNPNKPEPPIILCVARLTPQKDIPTLLRAFAIVRKSINCRLIIAGSGPELDKLKALTSKLDLISSVQFLGHVDDVSSLYLDASVMVLSSVFEGFGHVLIESLSYCVPIVATNCPTGPAEIITDEGIGYLAEVGNSSDLAEKIILALKREYSSEVLFARALDFSEEALAYKVNHLFETFKK